MNLKTDIWLQYIIMKNIVLASVFCAFIVLIGCKKNTTEIIVTPPINPCDTIRITTIATSTNTVQGQSLGTVTVTSPIGQGITYSIDSINYQSSVNFFNLAAGDYRVTAKNSLGCKGTTTKNISSYGPKFFAVKAIVTGYCGPCHINGTNSGGKNFDADASIESSWARIKARCVDGTPSFMPQASQLTALDKQRITDWINAGHRITD
jgi:hypothetical protein